MRGLARLDAHLAQPCCFSMLRVTAQVIVLRRTGKFNAKFTFNAGQKSDLLVQENPSGEL